MDTHRSCFQVFRFLGLLEEGQIVIISAYLSYLPGKKLVKQHKTTTKRSRPNNLRLGLNALQKCLSTVRICKAYVSMNPPGNSSIRGAANVGHSCQQCFGMSSHVDSE